MSDDISKKPADCTSMLEVRQAIDALDQRLMEILAQRIQYIHRAAEIKNSVDTIRDEQRIDSIINKRKAQAAEHGYSEDFIESFFRNLIEYSIAYEMRTWTRK